MIKNKKLFILTILCVSMFQMGMVALAPVVAALTQAFDGVSDLSAQVAMTFLNLVLVIVALFSGVISAKIGRRYMAVIAMILFSLVGVLAPHFSLNLIMVYFWSALLGTGIGLFVPAVSSMMMDFFDEEERSSVAGLQTAFVNIGGMILSFFAGILARGYWSRAYLVYLLALPVMFLAFFFLPKEERKAEKKKAAEKNKAGIPGAVWFATSVTFLFAVLYFAFSTNISLYLTESGFASTSLAGTATAVFMAGGCVCGFVFTKLFKLVGKLTPILAFVLLAVSYLLLYASHAMVILMIAAFIGGGSLSMIFPYYLVTIGSQVDPAVSVISSSLILSVGPNLGSFVSPMILSTLSMGTTAASRFLTAAFLALILGAILAVITFKVQTRSEIGSHKEA